MEQHEPSIKRLLNCSWDIHNHPGKMITDFSINMIKDKYYMHHNEDQLITNVG